MPAWFNVPPDATVTLLPNVTVVEAVTVTAAEIVNVPVKEYVPGSKLHALEIVTLSPDVTHVVAASAGVAVVNSDTKKPAVTPSAASTSRKEPRNERGEDI